MTTRWPSTAIEEVLIPRREEPAAEKLATGEIRIVAKIRFEDGLIQFRPGSGTKTGMILVRPGDLLVSGINAAKGAIALYDDDRGRPAAATIHYGAYSVREARADRRYLWLFFRSLAFRAILETALPGGIKTELKASRLLPLKIPLPDPPVQRRIVGRINELTGKTAEAQRLREGAAEGLDALWRSALRHAFADPVQPAVRLEAACEAIIDNLHSNPEYAEDGTVPCVRSPDVGWGTLHLESALRTDEQEYRRRTVRGEPRPDDIVLVREGGGTGKAALVGPGQRFSLGQRVMMLRPNTARVLPRYFLYQLLSPAVREDQIAPLSKGSASPHLNIGALRKFRFILPPLPVQAATVESLDAVRHQVDAVERAHGETAPHWAALPPAILDRAFRGEL